MQNTINDSLNDSHYQLPPDRTERAGSASAICAFWFSAFSRLLIELVLSVSVPRNSASQARFKHKWSLLDIAHGVAAEGDWLTWSFLQTVV